MAQRVDRELLTRSPVPGRTVNRPYLATDRSRLREEILEGLHGKVAEGIRSTTAALGLAARYGVEMPITEQMDAILHHGKSLGR